MTDELFATAKKFFTDRGLTVSEGKFLREKDAADSTTIEHRVADLHDAFADPTVKMLLTIRGGWNCNQLLPYLDYDLIKKNPKILCGFSDITALGNAIFAKTGLVTYSGPNMNQFVFGEQAKYTYDHFEAALMHEEPIELTAAAEWTDARFEVGKPWPFQKNDAWWTVHEGKAEGVSIGGNLCTLNLLQGTEYMPQVDGTILFLEDDHETHPRTFDRDLTSLTQQPWFTGVRGILFGRCQSHAVNTEFGSVTKDFLLRIIGNNAALKNIPIIANLDFGHTHPIFTFPIGGWVEMNANAKAPRVRIVKH